MKFTLATLAGLLLADQGHAFVSPSHASTNFRRSSSSSSARFMADMAPPPPPSNDNLPVIQGNSYGQPTDVRYSDFVKLVNADRIEKVTFSSDGTQLLGVDVDGVRVKIEALPNDPDLLTSLTNHKVRVFIASCVCRLFSCSVHRMCLTVACCYARFVTGRRDSLANPRGQWFG